MVKLPEPREPQTHDFTDDRSFGWDNRGDGEHLDAFGWREGVEKDDYAEVLASDGTAVRYRFAEVRHQTDGGWFATLEYTPR